MSVRSAFPQPGNGFDNAASNAVRNERLQQNLERSLNLSVNKRAEAIKAYPEWEQMRIRASKVRRDVITHLDVYLERFEATATANGIEVLWAEDAATACRHVLDLLEAHAITHVVKSKSMLTEETGLNDYLERRHIRVVETDLGEYIAQLDGQRPSHITAPIIHLSRDEVGRIMERHCGVPYTDSPEQLTAYARERLRQDFLAAGAGISGVNFGLAADGAIVIVENEGNARLSTTAPRLHIAMMGIERLLPSIHELGIMLPLLTASATGQLITNYVSIIRGPRGEGEVDGPDEVAVILVDNGRSGLLRDRRYRHILTCIRCGACMNVCPVYRCIGGHSYGSVYPGPIGAVLNPLIGGLPAFHRLPFASTLCGECSEVCPMMIPLHRMLLDLRADIVAAGGKPWWEHMLSWWASILIASPRLYRFFERIVRIFQPLLKRRDGSLPMPGWSSSRTFPALARHSFWHLRQKQHTKPFEDRNDETSP